MTTPFSLQMRDGGVLSMFYYFYCFIIYTNSLFKLRLNHDDDDWPLRRVYQPPKRPPPHPNLPGHIDASHYPTTRRVGKGGGRSRAAARENQGSRGTRRDTSQGPGILFCSLFNTILMYNSRLCLQWENDTSNRHDDEVWGSRQVFVCYF
jgi:hypothetical protein